ncbi:hypothetical protein MAR_009436, partial [Mya arenaria]
MATTVVYSTLMVLLAGSDRDFEDLWNVTGAENDPSANKHSLPISDVIAGGNFRSGLVDTWGSSTFETVSVSGMNKVGDVFFEVEYNISGTFPFLSSWMTQTNIVYSTHGVITDMSVTLSDSNYRVLVEQQSTGTAWFTITFGPLSYPGMPRMFAARRKNVPFVPPVVLDGNLGCALLTDLVNTTLMLTDSANMSPTMCTNTCWGISALALTVTAQHCYCGDIGSVPLSENPSQCYYPCPNTQEICGGLTSDYGSAYHVQ